jgi:hypothetical protein
MKLELGKVMSLLLYQENSMQVTLYSKTILVVVVDHRP